MSLIDEALKQAQAAHQGGKPEESLSEGSVPWTPPPLPDRSRLVRARVRKVLGWGLLGTLAGAVALVVFLRSRRPEAPPSPASAAVRASSAAAGLPPITSEVSVVPPPVAAAAGPPSAAGAPPRPSATAQVAETGAQRPSRQAPGGLRVEERGGESSRSSEPSPAVEAEHKGRAAPGPAVFAGELPLPEGGKITLDGIVYSDTNPVAVLNGKVIPPGGSVEGYTVTKILPDRIELEHEGKSVSITVR